MATREVITVSPAPNAVEVFCSYSHRDQALREELQTHLQPLQAKGLIYYWHDHAITAGDDWESRIDERLNSADLFLLLVSPDFMASRHCQIEMQRALERRKAGKARVIPILLRHVDWHNSPLGKIQALPKDGRPITTWPDRDQAFKDVTIGVRRVAEKLARSHVQGLTISDSSAMVPAPPARWRDKFWMQFGLIGLATILVLALAVFGGRELLRTGMWRNRSAKAPAFRHLRSGKSVFPRPPFYGAIDLGSKGTKASLFTKHLDLCPVAPTGGLCLVDRSVINTKLSSSMKEGQFTEEGIQDATDAVERELIEMQSVADKYGLQVGYYVVASSGVGKGKNKAALAAAIEGATGVGVDFIDARDEGYFGLLSLLPVDKGVNVDDAVFIDVGSGNTKVGCLVGGTNRESFRSAEVDYGSVTGRIVATQISPGDIASGIDRLIKEKVKPAYSSASKDVPCLGNRELIYWTGGAAWATATFTHPEAARKEMVAIARDDLSSFLVKLRDGSWNRPLQWQCSFSKEIPAGDREQICKAANQDRKKVIDVFAREDLLAGVGITNAILDSSNRSATIQFVRDGGNFLPGFVTEQYPERIGEGVAGGKKSN